MSRSLSFLLALLLLGGLLGCDTTATQPESQVVVEAYLQANRSLPSIRLSRTVDVEETYNTGRAAVRGAQVRVDRLAADSTVDRTVSYTESDSLPGVYLPNRSVVVAPQTTYRLRATTPDGAELRAVTTVPGPINLVEAANDTTTYQSPNQPSLTVRVNQPSGGNRRAGQQNVFTFTTTSLLDFANTPDRELRTQLTPFYADQYDADEDSLESFRIASSGLLNEGNFTRNADGTITIDLPWLAVAFFGPNEVAVNVVDDNYYDLLRSQSVQQGGFAPGEIPNVIEHVEGGTGLFGSYARAAQPVLIRRPQRQP